MDMSMPLEGVRVADLTIYVQGPVAAQILADLGAEVIKVEKPGVGDLSRVATRLFERTLVLPGDRRLLWEMGNHNKKSLTLDLYHFKGQELFYRLIERCDVLVTNLTPEALRQMGADEESVRQRNPDIIYARGSGFGPRGPYAEDPCQDTAGMARSGFMSLCSHPSGVPGYPPGAVADVASATMLAFGVVTALLARERTGRAPPVVYASQMSSMMWLALFPVALYANTGEEYPPFDRTDVSNPIFNIYRCGDGRWIALGLYWTERFWPPFCEATGLQHLRDDPRFATDEARKENRRELIRIIDEVMATRPSQEWERIFRERKFWFSIVNRYSDLPTDPQVQANGYLAELDNGLKGPSLPFELAGVQPRLHGAPALGEHTEQVLRELCGCSPEEIEALRGERVI